MKRVADTAYSASRAFTSGDVAILEFLRVGKTNWEIANALATSVSMVKWRVCRLFKALEVRNRIEAVIRAHQLRILAHSVPEMPPSGPMPESLSRGDAEVLRFLVCGMTNREIADALGLTTGTVRWRVSQLLGKTHARNRVEALARAHQRGWLQVLRENHQGNRKQFPSLDSIHTASLVHLSRARPATAVSFVKLPTFASRVAGDERCAAGNAAPHVGARNHRVREEIRK